MTDEFSESLRKRHEAYRQHHRYEMPFDYVSARAIRKWKSAAGIMVAYATGARSLCGYLQLPEGHPWWFLGRGDMDDLDRVLTVHGGVTYELDRFGWVGWDYDHAFDHWPEEVLREIIPVNHPGHFSDDQTWWEEHEYLRRMLAHLPDPGPFGIAWTKVALLETIEEAAQQARLAALNPDPAIVALMAGQNEPGE